MQLIIPEKFKKGLSELIEWKYYDETQDRILTREDAPEYLKKLEKEYIEWRKKQPNWN